MNGRPWIEVTKTVKSIYKRPTNADGNHRRVPEEKPKMKGHTDEEYDLTNVQSTTMKIRSTYVINALRNIVRFAPSVSLTSETLSLKEPYGLLVHNRKALENYMSNHPSPHDKKYRDECNEHIKTVLEFIDTELGERLNAEEALHNRETPMATFENLWMLLKPGDTVFTKIDGELGPAVINNVTIFPNDNGTTNTYAMDCWRINFNGERYGREWIQPIYYDPFNGEKEITSLPAYPMRFHKDALDKQDGITLEQRCIQRGKKFWNLHKAVMKEYNGLTVLWPKRHFKGRVMIDFQSFYKHNDDPEPNFFEAGGGLQNMDCACESCKDAAEEGNHRQPVKFSTYDDVDPKETTIEDDHFFLLCSRRVPAFLLQDRRWEIIDIEHVNDVKIDKKAFDHLVLPMETKNLLKALTWSYTARLDSPEQDHWSSDLIKIILLHGSPGVGKSRTAECVAEITGRPLLSITCADIGTEPAQVDRNLERYFSLGESWGAVMLLDEADIYLEQRERGLAELQHNSLVSIFLKALEIYKGILFLTTNRVGALDEGFASRFHVALRFPTLTDDSRAQIWKYNFDLLERDYTTLRVAESARSYTMDSSEIKTVKWNGREIRNALQTAVSLAEYEANENEESKVVLKRDHIQQVVQMSHQFKEYLKSIENLDPSKKAKKEGIRNDDFGVTNEERSRRAMLRSRDTD
ncbi:ATPase [Phlyctema vagabunda]|uniref:ATPase n=1 Tax=Phlyctema vagabunda TaxID=108571 RepID=A0ABR4PVB1_9HELO